MCQLYARGEVRFTPENRVAEGTSCGCICEEAVGQLEELPALCSAVDACCVGITWQGRSIVWTEDVLRCCLGSRPAHSMYDARKLSLAGPRHTGWSVSLLLWVVASDTECALTWDDSSPSTGKGQFCNILEEIPSIWTVWFYNSFFPPEVGCKTTDGVNVMGVVSQQWMFLTQLLCCVVKTN